MSKIQSGMTFPVIIKLMGGKNIISRQIVKKILNEGNLIDTSPVEPTFLGGLNSVYVLDNLAIYGNRLVKLYTEVCKEDLVYLISLTLAYKLNLIEAKLINQAIDHGYFIDFVLLLQEVKKEVPDLNTDYQTKSSKSKDLAVA